MVFPHTYGFSTVFSPYSASLVALSTFSASIILLTKHIFVVLFGADPANTSTAESLHVMLGLKAEEQSL